MTCPTTETMCCLVDSNWTWNGCDNIEIENIINFPNNGFSNNYEIANTFGPLETSRKCEVPYLYDELDWNSIPYNKKTGEKVG